MIKGIVWVLLIFGLAWVLSGLICEGPLIEPRYICIICEKPQWRKGYPNVTEGTICEKCFDVLWNRAIKEIGYKKDNYEQRDRFVADKIREYLEER